MLKNKFSDDNSKISKNTIIHGSVQTENSIVIQGEVLGYVASENVIKIMENGSTGNSIKGKNCVIEGAVRGDIEADNEIILSSTARVTGNLICKKLKIDQDAVLEMFQPHNFSTEEIYVESETELLPDADDKEPKDS
jgi:cytoskeletal protein CcmA (bactofilin family)